MFKKVDPLSWLAIAVAIAIAKVFFFPDTEFMEIIVVLAEAVCGIGALNSIHSEVGQRDSKTIQEVVSHVGRGVHKRIDENRELLELLQDSAPEILEKFPWVEGWIGANDEFFTELAKVVDVENPVGRNSSLPYPRPWPGRTR